MFALSTALVPLADAAAPVVTLEDMGDGLLMLCEEREDDGGERVCLTFDQLKAAYLIAAERYGQTEPLRLAA